MNHLADRLEQLLQLAVDSMPMTCGICNGAAVIGDGLACPGCSGTGVVTMKSHDVRVAGPFLTAVIPNLWDMLENADFSSLGLSLAWLKDYSRKVQAHAVEQTGQTIGESLKHVLQTAAETRARKNPSPPPEPMKGALTDDEIRELLQESDE